MDTGLIDTLISAAKKARKNAYAPYSGFAVGAAVMTDKNEVFQGVNIENLSYGLTVCAERVAVFSALSAGKQRFRAVAVVGDSPHPVFPCGSCRQVLWELAGDVEIIAANLQGSVHRVALSELLPYPFTMEGLSSPRDYFRKNSRSE